MGNLDGEDIPSFVHAILWGELTLFFSFALAALIGQLGRPEQFTRAEYAFQFLSLVSKGLLGGLLLQNVLWRSSIEESFQ